MRRDGIIFRVCVIRIGTGGKAPSRLECAIKITRKRRRHGAQVGAIKMGDGLS
jgi:hypothetical protein